MILEIHNYIEIFISVELLCIVVRLIKVAGLKNPKQLLLVKNPEQFIIVAG